VKSFWFVISILLPINSVFRTFTSCGSSSYMLIGRDGLYFALTTKRNGQTPNRKTNANSGKGGSVFSVGYE